MRALPLKCPPLSLNALFTTRQADKVLRPTSPSHRGTHVAAWERSGDVCRRYDSRSGLEGELGIFIIAWNFRKVACITVGECQRAAAQNDEESAQGEGQARAGHLTTHKGGSRIQKSSMQSTAYHSAAVNSESICACTPIPRKLLTLAILCRVLGTRKGTHSPSVMQGLLWCAPEVYLHLYVVHSPPRMQGLLWCAPEASLRGSQSTGNAGALVVRTRGALVVRTRGESAWRFLIDHAERGCPFPKGLRADSLRLLDTKEAKLSLPGVPGDASLLGDVLLRQRELSFLSKHKRLRG
eukprot:4203207-Pyramimonas_sp.AAC.1